MRAWLRHSLREAAVGNRTGGPQASLINTSRLCERGSSRLTNTRPTTLPLAFLCKPSQGS